MISDGFYRIAVAVAVVVVVFLGVRWLIEDVRIAWQMYRSRTRRSAPQETENTQAAGTPFGVQIQMEMAVQVKVNLEQANASPPEHERTWKRCPRGHWYSSIPCERCPRDQEPLVAASAEQHARIARILRHELVCHCIPHPLVREAFVRFVMALEEQEGHAFLMGDAIDLYRLRGIAALKNERPDGGDGGDDAGRAVCV